MKIYSVTEVLGKYIDWGKISDYVLAAACLRGTDTHFACHSYVKLGYVLNLPENCKGYLKSFTDWYDANVKKCILAEKRFHDSVLGFTGRPDFVFELDNGEIVLTDIKTPLAESPTWKCQLAAYEHLVDKIGGLEVDDIMSLRLHPKGGPARGKRYKGSRAAAFNAFLSALNAHRFING